MAQCAAAVELALLCDGRATSGAAMSVLIASQSVTRPGGRPGGSGHDTGWMRARAEQKFNRQGATIFGANSVADVDSADVAAEGVVLAHQAGAIIRSRCARGDRTADDGGADEARTEAPTRME